MASQRVCQQRDLSHTSRWHLIVGLLLACCVLPAAAQQSTRYEQFELHHSIVYTTFLSPEVAAEYGIARGADKAILTLSVRDADAGDIAGRPMKIEGRTWDLITGVAPRITSCPLNSWIGNTVSLSLPFNRRALPRPLSTK